MNRTLLAMLAAFSLTLPGAVHAEQIHLDTLGVGVSVASVVEQPTWAMVKEDGNVALYTAWLGPAAALLALERAPDSDRIVRFTVRVPGGGVAAAENYQSLREGWGALHEPGQVNRIERRVSCLAGEKQVITHRLAVGQLYEVLLTPAGSHPQGVLLQTQQPPQLSPRLADYVTQIEQGALAAADPGWSSAYLLQKSMGEEARKNAPACEPAKPFGPLKEFTLGQAMAQQPNFEWVEGQWRYPGFFVAFDLALAEGDATADSAGRLNSVRFTRQKLSQWEFLTLTDNAKMAMGPAQEMTQLTTTAGVSTRYRWKTAAGSVSLRWDTQGDDRTMGTLQVRYALRDAENRRDD